MSDKPNTPVIIDAKDQVTIHLPYLSGHITNTYDKGSLKDEPFVIVALAEEVIKLRNPIDRMERGSIVGVKISNSATDNYWLNNIEFVS